MGTMDFIPPKTREQKLEEILSKKPRIGKGCRCLECLYYNDDDISPNHTCNVYEDGIPSDIISGIVQHNHSLDNDYGIIFSKYIQIPLPEY